MAGLFGSSGGSSSGSLFPSSSPGGGGGGHGLIHNLVSDAVTTAKGIVPGMIQFAQHPVTSAELAWAQTKAMYAPLFHGQFGKFYENFHSHPLQPLLDAVSIPAMAFGGLGAGIKGASALADMGRVAELASAGRLAEGAAMTADLSRAPRLFQAAEHFRPATDFTTRKLPTSIPGVYETQAYSTNLWRRALTRGGNAIFEGLANKGAPIIRGAKYDAEGNLVKHAGAFDYTAVGRGDRELAKTLSRRKAGTIKAIKSQAHAIHAAAKAGGSPEEIAHLLTQHFDESFLREAIMVNGHEAAQLGKPGGALAHFRYIEYDHKAMRDAGKAEAVRSRKVVRLDQQRMATAELAHAVPSIRDELARANEKLAQMHAKGHHVTPIKGLDQAKMTQRQLTKLEFNAVSEQQDLVKRLTKRLEKAEAAKAKHDSALEQLAAHRGASEAAQGVEHFRVPKTKNVTLEGFDPHHIQDFVKGLGQRFRLTEDPTRALRTNDGRVFMVRKELPAVMSNEIENTHRLLTLMHNAPLKAWKYMILAQAPRYFFNNVVGNTGMLAAATNPVALTRGVLDAIRSVKGDRAAVRAAREMEGEVNAQITRWMPNDFVDQHFGYLTHSVIGTDNALGFDRTASTRIKGGLRSGLHGVTEKVAYRATQRVGLMAAMREIKAVRDMEQVFRMRGLSGPDAFQAAARKALMDPKVRAAVEKRVTDWAGQYYHLNSLERKLTALVPFYNWDRHALRFGKEQVLSRPGSSALLAMVGQQGADSTRQQLGPLPDYMEGAVPIPGHLGGVLGFIFGGTSAGRKKVVLTGGLNPLGAAAEDANAALHLVGLGTGAASDSLGNQLSPIATGAISAITGSNPVTGQAVKDRGGLAGTVLSETFGGLPQVDIVKNLIHGNPSTVTSQGKPRLYTHDTHQLLASLFGLNVRDFSPEAAAIVVKQQEGTSHHHKRKSANLFG